MRSTTEYFYKLRPNQSNLLIAYAIYNFFTLQVSIFVYPIRALRERAHFQGIFLYDHYGTNVAINLRSLMSMTTFIFSNLNLHLSIGRRGIVMAKNFHQIMFFIYACRYGIGNNFESITSKTKLKTNIQNNSKQRLLKVFNKYYSEKRYR
jgi:hypothetical protein